MIKNRSIFKDSLWFLLLQTKNRDVLMNLGISTDRRMRHSCIPPNLRNIRNLSHFTILGNFQEYAYFQELHIDLKLEIPKNRHFHRIRHNHRESHIFMIFQNFSYGLSMYGLSLMMSYGLSLMMSYGLSLYGLSLILWLVWLV